MRHGASAALKGSPVTRRHHKEYRPDEALSLITADREARPSRCPSCGGGSIIRHPVRVADEPAPPGRVTLTCEACERVVSYIDRGAAKPGG